MFDIENLNLISDDENYYFFRVLEDGDMTDINNGSVNYGDGEFSRLRTDRERWEESHSDRKAKNQNICVKNL